jgi:hypothetical protein
MWKERVKLRHGLVEVISYHFLICGISEVTFGVAESSSGRLVNVQDVIWQGPGCRSGLEVQLIGDIERTVFDEKAKKARPTRTTLKPQDQRSILIELKYVFF